MQWDWEGLLGRPQLAADRALAPAALRSQCLLITGAGGSIGSRVSLDSLHGRPRTLLLLDSSEHALYEICKRITAAAADKSIHIVPVLGDFADRTLLDFLFRQHRPTLIFHTAAYKHVPLMEQNPIAAMANNAVGTYKLVLAALDHGRCEIVLTSTDKAVHPTSIMGASKRAAELVVLSHSCSAVPMNAVRLGNVLGSSGSVVALFQEQLESGSNLTVTHANARRYFLTADEAASALLRAVGSGSGGKIFLADCGPSVGIVDLARYMTDAYNPNRQTPPGIETIGLRPGEKLEELQFSSDELIEGELFRGMQVLTSPCPTASFVAARIERIDAAIQRMDLQEIVSATQDLVTDYRPAESLRATALAVGDR